MDDSTEDIRHQMEETRESLHEKLETLEQQVKETVQGAADTVSTVKDTVEAVRETMHETACTMKETVHDTVDSVKESVAETVESVKESLNLRHQVEEHPWAMLAGAVAVGFVGAKLLLHMTGPPAAMTAAMSAPTPPVSPDRPERPSVSHHNGHGPKKKAAAVAAKQEPGWWSLINEQFGGELNKLKGLAIGAAGNVIREVLTSSAPPPMVDRIKEVVDGMTEKLGGQRLEGSILDFGSTSEQGEHHEEWCPPKAEGSVGATPREGPGEFGRFDRR